VGPVNENCTVITKVLPNGIEAALPYQVVNALVNGTVTSAEASEVPVGEVKWNTALVILRGVERPVTEILNPLLVIAPGVTPVTTGTVELTVIVCVGVAIVLPAESCAVVVIVIVPATVPMITGTLVAVPNNPCVLPAGIVKLAVVPVPVPNFAS
jgi:hypothetical protein